MGICVMLALVPVQNVWGAVYEAPHYQVAWAQPASTAPTMCMGPAGPCGVPVMGYAPMASPADKLGRGITNAVTGWMELPKHMVMGTFACGVTPLEGLTVGIFRGVGRAVERTGVGLYETATFPIPNYTPLLYPEYISLEPAYMGYRRAPYVGAWGAGSWNVPAQPYYGVPQQYVQQPYAMPQQQQYAAPANPRPLNQALTQSPRRAMESAPSQSSGDDYLK